MADPLSQVIQLLRPAAVVSKGITGAGRWAVRYSAFGQPGFAAVTEGRCRLVVEGVEPVVLEAGDFVLLPATPAFTMSGFEPAPAVRIDARRAAEMREEEVRFGRRDGPPDMRQIGGYFTFAARDAGMLASLLPRMIHLRGIPRLAVLVEMLGAEAGDEAAGRELILERLVEILLVEALRAVPGDPDPGLVRGLGDARIGAALRALHGDVARDWTVEALAREAGLSRSRFFDRFRDVMGLRPMEYLLGWRMALARALLADGGSSLEEVAAQIGYGTASTFSTAFRRHVGQPPGQYMRQAAQAAGTGLPAWAVAGR